MGLEAMCLGFCSIIQMKGVNKVEKQKEVNRIGHRVREMGSLMGVTSRDVLDRGLGFGTF